MTARTITAPGPGPEREALRQAYLGLLKLALCDLIGTTTTSVVEGLPGGGVRTADLASDELEKRVEGMDWPVHGLTMTGLRRLDDLQGCVESVVDEEIDGDLIETGSWRGGSSMLMRATLDSLGARERKVYVADSFAGFPTAEQSPPTYPQTCGPYFTGFELLTAPLDEVRASFRRLGLEASVEFVPGLFEQTLPSLRGHSWSLIRLDGDTYDATMLALRCLYDGLSPGGYVIVDDYGALEECRTAVTEFRAQRNISQPLTQIDFTCVRWQRARAPASS